MIYNSLILPHINYSLPAWGSNCHSVELLQKKAVQVVNFKSPVTHIEHIKNVNQLKGECSVFLEKIILWMKTIHYPNTLRSHLVTIVPMAPFTLK